MFNLFLLNFESMLMRLSQSDLQDIVKYCGIIAVIGFVIYIAMLIVGMVIGVAKAKDNSKDDNKTEVYTKGIVLEKFVESSRESGGAFVFKETIEWIIFEEENGSRKRVRIIKPNEIFIAVGDKGTLITRGETVYGFMRETER